MWGSFYFKNLIFIFKIRECEDCPKNYNNLWLFTVFFHLFSDLPQEIIIWQVHFVTLARSVKYRSQEDFVGYCSSAEALNECQKSNEHKTVFIKAWARHSMKMCQSFLKYFMKFLPSYSFFQFTAYSKNRTPSYFLILPHRFYDLRKANFHIIISVPELKKCCEDNELDPRPLSLWLSSHDNTHPVALSF